MTGQWLCCLLEEPPQAGEMGRQEPHVVQKKKMSNPGELKYPSLEVRLREQGLFSLEKKKSCVWGM